MEITTKDFGQDFKWGVSTAAFQIEGAYDADEKGASIWDVFSMQKDKVYQNQHAKISCDFYNRYIQDLILMQSLNIPNYRFSLSWSRIIPNGIGKINCKGVDFYNRVIDFCLELGIEPWVTLYHWDLPNALQKKGGWTNRDIINWFSDYVSLCIQKFGDRVKRWMVLNEPMVFTGAGYFLGIHAPGKKGLTNFLASIHHAAMCQSEGARVAKSLRSNLKIGTTFSCSHIEPLTNRESDICAARKADALLNRTFIETLSGLGYPTKDLKLLNRIEQVVKAGDENKLQFNMDFIGIQNYTREIVTHSYFIPFINAKIIRADKRNVERKLMNWEIHPPSIYHILKKFSAYASAKEIIVTENGAAFRDEVCNGCVHDINRKKYLQDHIQQVLKAKQEGVNVNGYFVWSFTDNFEWAEGYHPRFGIVHVDFSTQKRIVKDSGKWYGEFLSGRNLKVEIEQKSELKLASQQ
ncbi:MAG: beta-glucosidase [Parafilimonas sp.]|nr:beta-glucosidase [Parafilimonas sp.]